jgi:hypothetical protein
MTTPQEELRAAGDARHVLDNPVFQKAKADLYDRLRQARKAAPIGATELHARLIITEQVADQFFDYFELVLQTGKLAQAHIDETASQQGLKERGLALFRTLGRNHF